jgi:hypothetical protein
MGVAAWRVRVERERERRARRRMGRGSSDQWAMEHMRCMIERESNLGCSTGAAAEAVFTLVR